MQGHYLCGLQHVLYDALHVGAQPLWLQVQQLHQPRTDRLSHFRAWIMRQRKQARQIPGTSRRELSGCSHRFLQSSQAMYCSSLSHLHNTVTLR